MVATPEQASIIGFQRKAIQNLLQFLDFRQAYEDFTEQEIATILENELSSEIIRQLTLQQRRYKAIDMVTISGRIKEMKSD